MTANSNAKSSKKMIAAAKNLKLAANALKSGKSYGEVAKKYGIARSTAYNMAKSLAAK